jgi:ionotropic glutamate receptor NMDA 1
MSLRIDENRVMWPGRLRKKPEEFILPTHLKVLTIEEKPFVYTREIQERDGDECYPEEVRCPYFNSSMNDEGKVL